MLTVSKTCEDATSQVETGQGTYGNSSRLECDITAPHWLLDEDSQNPNPPPIEPWVGCVLRANNATTVSTYYRNSQTTRAPGRKVLCTYFHHFPEILPLMYLPSFDPDRCPFILATSPSATGASFVRDDSSSSDFSRYLAAYSGLLSQYVS